MTKKVLEVIYFKEEVCICIYCGGQSTLTLMSRVEPDFRAGVCDKCIKQ